MLKPGTFQLNKNLDEFLSQFRNNFHHPSLEHKNYSLEIHITMLAMEGLERPDNAIISVRVEKG
jgi:hypothetical protein